MSNLKLFKNIISLAKRLAILFVFFCMGNSLYAQNISVPEDIQAALLVKVLKYNPQIPQTEKARILVVYNTSTELNKDEFVKGLGESMIVKAIMPTELEDNISGYDVVYFMPGIHGYSEICKSNNVLSVTGTAEYVEEGEVSLGFSIQNNKPKILVNLTSLDEETQSFSSDILRIAKIFK